AMPELFLAIDGILQLCIDVGRGLVVHKKVIGAHLERELPFMATENLMMDAVRAGGDRQELHERIRVHARAAADRLKEGAAQNDLFERLAGDSTFAAVRAQLEQTLDPAAFVGRAPVQVDEYLAAEVDPLLSRHADLVGGDAEVVV
ncbi:MAG: adenylosuccinate lyase, partial [Planctomycetota bacterium]|nr:adenylosuccinate lyase [Planctomycetota bacterium]